MARKIVQGQEQEKEAMLNRGIEALGKGWILDYQEVLADMCQKFGNNPSEVRRWRSRLIEATTPIKIAETAKPVFC